MELHAGGNLQAALDSIMPGETLFIEQGVEFVGNFLLPKANTLNPVVIRTMSTNLPTGQRVGPNDLQYMPVIKSPNAQPALRCSDIASGYNFVGICFKAGSSGDIVVTSNRNDNITFDRCVFKADPTSKNGLVMHASHVAVENSWFTGIKLPGTESHAIVCWDGPGPYNIVNNHIEAGSIGVLFGGAPPSVPNLIPSDIIFERNLVTRPVEYRTQNIGVKNLFELKNAQRVKIHGNIFENNWPQAQDGQSIIFTVRSHSPNAPWSVVKDVEFKNNIVRHVAMVFNILGRDDTYPSGVADNILIENNLFEDVNHLNWGGNGVWAKIGGGPTNLVIRNNTVFHSGNIISAYSQYINPGFLLDHNLFRHNNYGIHGDGTGTGNPCITRYFPSGVINNVFGGGVASQYPLSNTFISVDAWNSMFSSSGRQSQYPGYGCDIDELERALQPYTPIKVCEYCSSPGVDHIGELKICPTSVWKEHDGN